MSPIGLCCDHAGYELKEIVKGYVESLGFEVRDFGTNSTESCDYADFAHPCACAIENGEIDRAIAICGSGNGIAMTLNHHRGIRAALCWDVELARLARAHNDANVVALPARFIAPEKALAVVDAFLNTPFEGGRHLRRINKIDVTDCKC